MHRPTLVLILFLSLGSAAHAQNPTSSQDSSIRPQRGRGDVNRADPVFRRTVACVVERLPDRTRNLLATIPGTAAEDRILASFQSRLDWCFNGIEGGLSFSWNLLRGGIAEIYYHRAFPAGLPRAPAPAAAQAAAWAQPRAATYTSPDRAQYEMLHALARCVVLRRPGLVSDLLAAPPLGAGESAAVGMLQGDLSACLTSGITFTASRQSLRGLLAEAALHYGEAYAGGFGPASPAPAASD